MTDKIETDRLDLEAIRRRLAAATPGPWTAEDDGLVWADNAGPGDPVSGSVQPADAEFIAHSITDVAALLAEVDRQAAEIEEHRRTIRNLSEAYHATTSGDAR